MYACYLIAAFCSLRAFGRLVTSLLLCLLAVFAATHKRVMRTATGSR